MWQKGKKQDCTRKQRTVTGLRKLSLSRNTVKWYSLQCPSGRAGTELGQFPTRVYSSSALYSQACLTFSFSLATSMICSKEALSSLVCFAKKVSRLGRASLSSFSASPNKRREEAWGRLMLFYESTVSTSQPSWKQAFHRHTITNTKLAQRNTSTQSGAVINQVWNTCNQLAINRFMAFTAIYFKGET